MCTVDKNFRFTLAFLRDNKACSYDRREAALAQYLGIPPVELTWDSGLTLHRWADVYGADGDYSANNIDLIWAAQAALDFEAHALLPFADLRAPQGLRTAASAYPYDEAVRDRVLNWWTDICAKQV